MRTSLILLAALFLSSVVRGELPPRAYLDMQNRSPEYLEIRVIDVDKGLCIACTRQSVEVKAEVVRVLRSGEELKPGDTICIRYSLHRPRRGWTGPGPVPVLTAGKNYPAFLKKTAGGKCFEPAAGGSSFDQPVSEK